jgi:shikimate dehydrogenase
MQYLKLGPRHTFLQDMGAANTLKFTDAGWHGYNTDGTGLYDALRFGSPSVDIKNAHIVLLGAGGAARAAAVKCLGKCCASLWIGNRTQANRKDLVEFLQLSITRRGGEEISIKDFDPANREHLSSLPRDSVVINATSLGLKRSDGSPLDLAQIPKPRMVFDMIYNPPQTALLQQAERLNIPSSNGLSMLVYQGALSLHFWTREKIPVDVMMNAARAALAAR